MGFRLPPGSNLCYRNAALLLMLHTSFAEWAAADAEEDHVDCGVDVVPTCPLCKFHALARAYWHGDRTKNASAHEAAMDELWALFAEGTSSYRDAAELSKQQDILEFLEKFLDDLTQLKHGPMTGQLGYDARPPTQIVNAGIQFPGRCEACGFRETPRPYDANYHLSVALEQAPPQAGQNDTLERFMMHTWDDVSEDREQCPKCTGEAFKRSAHITVPPEVLMLSIQAWPNKYARTMDVPEEFEITAERATMPENHGDKIEYKTQAVVFHIGQDFSMGHYTIGVRQRNGQWAYLNNDFPPRVFSSLQALINSVRNVSPPKPDLYVIVAQRELKEWLVPEIQEPVPQFGGGDATGQAESGPRLTEAVGVPETQDETTAEQRDKSPRDPDPSSPSDDSLFKEKEPATPPQDGPSDSQPLTSDDTNTNSLLQSIETPGTGKGTKRARDSDNSDSPKGKPAKRRNIMANVQIKVWSHEFGPLRGQVKVPMKPFRTRKSADNSDGDNVVDVAVNIRDEGK